MAESEGSEDSNLVVIPVDDNLSDGNKDTWPLKDPKWDYRVHDDTRWKEGLAGIWVAETGAKEFGVEYILEKLPEGYCLFDRPRGTDPSTRDSFLYGHPSGGYFQSRNEFFPHFQWLMSERNGDCRCKVCLKALKATARVARVSRDSSSTPITTGFKPSKGKRIRRTKAEIQAGLSAEEAMALRKGSPAVSPKVVDKSNFVLGPLGLEGPDYWRAWIQQMRKESPEAVDIRVNQPLNKNWVFGKGLLDNYFVQLGLDASFTPRKGETVLWVNEMDGTLQWNPETRTYQVLSYDGAWLGAPKWRAGIITQTPVPEQKTNYPADIHDLTSEEALDNVTNTGFRVECLPDPIDDDKSFSKHASYVPLKCIKPMNSWEIFLDKVPRENWHPTIEFALTSTSSFSMLHHQWFRGTWPNARIHSKGIWVGHELLAVKDTIRLKPFGLTMEDLEDDGKSKDVNRQVTDVMTITDIWLEWKNCITEVNVDGYAEEVTAWIQGRVYTLDKDRMSRPTPFGDKPLKKLTDHEVDCAFNQVGMSEYGDWYRMNDGNTCQITPGSVLGRCYEPVPTKIHFGSFDLDYDLQSVLKARRYSTQVDNRIPEGHLWFFGDNRVETLGLAEINGKDVGAAALVHQQPDRWSAILKIYQGIQTPGDVRRADLGEEKKRGRPRKAFEDIGKTSRLVSTGLGLEFGSSTEDVEEEETDSEDGLPEGELTRSIPFDNSLEFVEITEHRPGSSRRVQDLFDDDEDGDYAL